MIARESSTFYNTKENIVMTRKPTWTDQRAWEGKLALQQYSRTSLEEEHYQHFHPHSWNYRNKNRHDRDTKKRGHEMNNIYRFTELNAGQREQSSNIKSNK